MIVKKRTGQAQFVAVALSRTAVIRSLEMLHDARMAAMTGRAAALSGMVELPIWAVRFIRHQGLIVKDAAPCTFLHKGREPDLRCKCELKFDRQREPTFNLSQIDGSCCDAEGSCEPIATDAAIYTNLTGARKSNIGREGFLSGQSVSTD